MAEDRKVIMDSSKPASYNNPHVKRAISMLSANANGDKLLTLASVGKREVYDIRSWSADRTRADKFGVQISKNEIEDYAYALLPFVADKDLTDTVKARGLSLEEAHAVDLGIEGLAPVEAVEPAPTAAPVKATLSASASAQDVTDFFASATLEQLEYEIARRKAADFEAKHN